MFYDEDFNDDDSGDVDFLQRFDYAYDASGNRTFSLVRQAGHTNDRSWLYGYDPLNRLVFAENGTLESGNQQVAAGGTGHEWRLDILGNWSGGDGEESYLEYEVADGVLGFGGAPDDLLRTDHHNTDAFNRISSRVVQEDPGGETPDPVGFAYDAGGNLIFDGERFYVYDASNRLVETKQKGTLSVNGQGVLEGSPGSTVGEYTYDARGRLISRKVSNSGALNTDGAGDFFYYDGARDIEHHKSDVGGVLSLHRQYVYGLNYVDEVVAFNDSTDDDDGRAYLHRVLQDANYNVVAVANSQGAILQQYTYSPYGQRLTAENVEVDPITGDVTGVNPIDLATEQHTLLTQKGHQGLMHAPEYGGVHNRNRDRVPRLGRFLQMDQNGTGLIVLSSLGFHGAAPMVSAAVDAELQYADGGNIYNAYRNNPVDYVDPTGLAGVGSQLFTAFGKWIPSVLDVARFSGYFIGLRIAQSQGGWGPKALAESVAMARDKTKLWPDISGGEEAQAGVVSWFAKMMATQWIPNLAEMATMSNSDFRHFPNLGKVSKHLSRFAKLRWDIFSGPTAVLGAPFVAAGAAYVGILDAVLWSTENDF